MAAKRSDVSGFVSKYGGGFQTAQQALAELMCERLARRKRLGLPLKFWADPEWKRSYLAQLRLAAKLLRDYPAEVVFRGLRTPDGEQAYSLGAAWLRPLFEAARVQGEAEAAARAALPPPPPLPPVDEPPRPTFVPRPSLFSRLKALDG